MTDSQLLRQYVEGSNQAFGELVRRHSDWVYSVARRRVRDSHLAEDVTQATFVVLARKASSLREQSVLSSWLFQVVRLTSFKALREEARRRRRETEAALRMQTSPSADEDQSWQELEPLLDESVARLRRGDRQALLLRFYERKSFAEVADALGSTEDAVRKRVSRAVEKLRGMLERRGVALAPAMLPTVLWNRTVETAPASIFGAAQSLSIQAAAESAELLAKGTIRMLNFYRARAAAIAVLVLLVAGLSGTALVERATGQPGHTQSQPADKPKPADASEHVLKVTQITPILNVQDVPASLEYYVEKLGFKKQFEHGDPPTFAAVERDGCTIMLAQGEQGHPGTWIYVAVTDVNALHADLVARGAMINDPPSDRPWLMREMLVQDPDGHQIRIGSFIGGAHGHDPKR